MQMLFTAKLEPSRSHRTHIYRIFYWDIYQRCTRISHKKACKINASSSLKNMFLNEENALSFQSFVLNYTFIHDAFCF